ncbi:MAG: hypothetical protein KC457_09060 [Myxococcales bacterium]|nr:hypothetical protein [Myxococcales bacterium]
MSRFHSTFAHRHAILPVIHVRDRAQALANARIARECGTDGVFLINHDVSIDELLDIHGEVAEQFRGWFVGVNCLGLPAPACFARLSPAVSGLWVDDARIDERAEAQPAAEEIAAARMASSWPGLYFGGVAFKYQRPVAEVGRAAATARAYMDVVTTSGPGTGAAASVEKIRLMHEALEGAPLAIASGITPENVGDFLPYASAFLVATGISRNFHDLDPRRVARLVGVVRAHDGASRGLTRSSYGQGEGTRSGHPVVLIDLTWGPVFEIDLSHFSEQVFAYRCDDPPRVDALEGLEQVGTVEIDGRPAILLRVPADFSGDFVRLRSGNVGEFWAELFQVPAEGPPRLLWRDDFCLK